MTCDKQLIHLKIENKKLISENKNLRAELQLVTSKLNTIMRYYGIKEVAEETVEIKQEIMEDNTEADLEDNTEAKDCPESSSVEAPPDAVSVLVDFRPVLNIFVNSSFYENSD